MRSADLLDAPAGEDAVGEAVGHAGAQQLLGDPLEDRVAGHVARGGVDQRPAHRTPEGVLGERALQHVVDGPLRVRGRDHGIDDGQRGVAGEIAGGRPRAALQAPSGRDGLWAGRSASRTASEASRATAATGDAKSPSSRGGG